MSTPFIEEDNPLFNNDGSSSLHETVDKLFNSNVGEYVALPIIVAIGDQSSGKSSVLEGLTNLPFLQPSSTASASHKKKVEEWHSDNVENLTAQEFENIVHEAHITMELDSGNQNSMYSRDVLRLEISGPQQSHFSVVDVPGIFRSSTPGRTTKEDQAMVKQIMEEYMESPRSIMLAVVPANVDIATQEVLEMARHVDAEGSRTLGVLTKPDLVDPGTEGAIMDLIKCKSHKLALGWCVVRNPGQLQLVDGTIDRQVLEEKFFQEKSPWNELPKDRVGISELRKRLRVVLTKSIRRAFPEMELEIQKKLTEAKQAMEELGPSRETPSDQMCYAMQLGADYHKIAMAAINANYGDEKMFEEDQHLRFATWLKNRNELFNQTMIDHGHKYEFQANEEVIYIGSRQQDVLKNGTAKRSPAGDPVELRTCRDHPDLVAITSEKSTVLKANGRDRLEWLTKLYNENVGFGIPTVDSPLVAKVVKQQTEKWKLIAKNYISDVVTMAHTFVTEVLDRLTPTDRVFEGLMEAIWRDLTHKYRQAMHEVDRLVVIETVAPPFTLDHNYSEALERSRQARYQANMNEKAFRDPNLGPVVRMQDTVISTSLSNSERGILDVHDMVKAYYEVARKRFTDNVIREACLYVLVSSKDSPLKVFSQNYARRLNKDMLEKIAGEDDEAKATRGKKQQEISRLEAGKRILDEHNQWGR